MIIFKKVLIIAFEILVLLLCFSITTEAKLEKGTTINLAVGESYYIYNTENTNITKWKTSDKSIAIVNNGLVLAKNIGMAKISADINGEILTWNININPLRIDLKKSSIVVGEQIKASLKGCPQSETIEWILSNEEIAQIDQYGIITALKPGKTKLKAKCGKKTVSKTITINPFKVNLNRNDIAFIKYTPAVFSDSTSHFNENSMVITDTDIINEIIKIVNSYDYNYLSNEKIMNCYTDDINRKKKKLTSFIVRDNLILYNKSGDVIAVLSENEKVSNCRAFLGRLFINDKYYYCNNADISLTAIVNSWKCESDIIKSAKKYCKNHGKKSTNKVTIEYYYVSPTITPDYIKYLDKTNIVAYVHLGKNIVLVSPSTAKSIGFEDQGIDD